MQEFGGVIRSLNGSEAVVLLDDGSEEVFTVPDHYYVGVHVYVTDLIDGTRTVVGESPRWIAFIRDMDESDAPRSYWRFYDESDGSTSFAESVNKDGEERAVKTLVVDTDGSSHHYWWQQPSDGEGGLGELPIDTSFPGLDVIDAKVFFEWWNRDSVL